MNRDRRRDLVCQIANHVAGFEPTDEEGVLKGRMLDGMPFEGCGILKVIPEKRRGRHESRRHDRDDDDDDRRRHRDRKDR